MRQFSVICLFLTISFIAYGQKPFLDSSVYNKWPEVYPFPLITNDGNYSLCMVKNDPVGSNTLILQSSDGSWRFMVNGVMPNSCRFTKDGRNAICIKQPDSLVIISLGENAIQYLANANAFDLYEFDKNHWIIYRARGLEGIAIFDLFTQKTEIYSGVNEYWTGGGDYLYFMNKERIGNGINEVLLRFRVTSNSYDTLWRGNTINKMVFSDDRSRLAFLAIENAQGNKIASLWYCDGNMISALKLPVITGNESELKDIQSFFGKDMLLLSFQKPLVLEKPKPGAVSVDVWNYQDAKLQSLQLSELGKATPSTCVYHIKDKRAVRIEEANDRLIGIGGKVGLVEHVEGDADVSEVDWSAASRHSFYLVSIEDGSRLLMNTNVRSQYRLSPDGKFVIFYDNKKHNYFSYCITDRVIRNITGNILTNWTKYDEVRIVRAGVTGDYLPAGWTSGDSSVLLYDQHDIWQVDPRGKNTPINLTNGYGRKRGLFFELIREHNREIFGKNEKVILSVFNWSTKENGFFSKVIGKTGDPDSLSMGPYFYMAHLAARNVAGEKSFTPIKAKNREIYIVRRMSATESPNYFVTEDFRHFQPLTDVYPERRYNWYVVRLCSWKARDGMINQGLLYEPENFDSKKRYPIIFWYYHTLSDYLNIYIKPEPSDGDLNIAYYVSNGYLVFTPDIHYKIGQPGPSALKSINSALSYLTKFAFIDTHRMGIQGLSFGGFETNYLVTHTHIFAAACTASGMTDFISAYGSLMGDGRSQESKFEIGAYLMNTSLWERPDLYALNSPILKANEVTTPLLMMSTKSDFTVPFGQSVELFTALRRLGKKVWMLQYDDGNHGVWGNSAIDFSIRMQQFFDHYLKGAPTPVWMSKGIPAARKGLDTGLELEKPNSQIVVK